MPKKILLADDSITIQKVVELTFSEGDYQVFSVGNGALALKKIHEVRPDIALLDVIMPEANGYEVCEKVKRNPETSWIPVLLLTGTFEPFDRKRADAAGANGHLTKPFESQMLIAKVEELIAGSRHPVAEPALGRMEIVEGGELRVAAEASSPLREPEPSPEAEREELTRHTILPDRYDELSRRADPGEPAGIQTIRISSEEVLGPRPAPFPEEARPFPPPEGPPETWDELASDLVSGSPAPDREPGPLAPESFPRAAAPPPVTADSAAPVPPSPFGETGGVSRLAGPAAAPSPGILSAADLDRIAAQVVERMSEKVVREVAWEIIPELAENLIRQRIRELEEKINRES